ncbi:hypothetical protein AGMMS49983_21080 [Clostridia bacterium]|nr:hypothetical protein AGMMS49983_21080 [Clostridia bacterium]
MDENKKKQAEKVYATLVNYFDGKGFSHTDEPEELVLRCTFKTDDLPADLRFKIIGELDLIHLLSTIPVQLSADRIEEGCLAACSASNDLFDGNFIVNSEDGSIVYKLSYYYTGSIIGEEMIDYMLDMGLAMIDRYNDRFLLLQKGLLSAAEFVAQDE